MPRVAMNEGIFSFVLNMPFRNPASPPIPRDMGMIHKPTSFVLNLLRTRRPDEYHAERHDPLDGEIDAAQHDDLMEADCDNGRYRGKAEDDLQIGKGQVLAPGPDGEEAHDDYQ